MTVVELRILGPVEARIQGRPVSVGYAKQRCVLGLLAAEVGHVVGVDRIADRVWGSNAPNSVRNILYGHVARLRSALAAAGAPAELLRRQAGGYLIDAPSTAVDLHRFRSLTRRARAATHDRVALALLDEAIGLWRGPALAGTDGPWPERMRSALERERTAARLAVCEVRLRLGLHDGLIADLTDLASDEPLHEGVAHALMLALYHQGDVAAAFDYFGHFRDRLAEELGTDPGPQLRALHQRMLRRDRVADLPAQSA